MANAKISELIQRAPDGTEYLEVIIPPFGPGSNRRVLLQDIVDLAGSGGTSIPFGSTSGTNTYTIAATPAVTAYTDGMLLHVRVAISSTGLVTFNFDSIGAKKLLDTDGSQATDGYLKAGVDYIVTYNSALDSAAGAFTVVNEIQHGVMNLRGVFAASGGLYPGAGGSGPAGAIRHGDAWIVSGTDTIGSVVLRAGDFIFTGVDAPGQTASNWYVIPGYASIVGVQDLPIPAQAMWPRVTSGCSVLTQYEIATSLLNLQGLEFSATVQQFAQFVDPLPRKWNNGTITALIHWKPGASGSGDVRWGIQLATYRNDDPLTGAFGSEVAVTDTYIAENDEHITTVSGAITPSGTLQDGNLFALQVNRDPTNGADTLDVTAILISVILRITTDAAIDG